MIDRAARDNGALQRKAQDQARFANDAYALAMDDLRTQRARSAATTNQVASPQATQQRMTGGPR